MGLKRKFTGGVLAVLGFMLSPLSIWSWVIRWMPKPIAPTVDTAGRIAWDSISGYARGIVIVANLKPAKLMGIESNGMVLAASPEGGKPMLVGFDEPPAPGTRIR